MRTFALLAALLASAVALAGIALDQTVIVTFTDCSSGGSAAQTVTAGEYVLSVKNEDTWLCQAASGSTCGSGGTVFPAPQMLIFTVGGSPGSTQSISCRSTNSTGDLQLTRRGN